MNVASIDDDETGCDVYSCIGSKICLILSCAECTWLGSSRSMRTLADNGILSQSSSNQSSSRSPCMPYQDLLLLSKWKNIKSCFKGR